MSNFVHLHVHTDHSFLDGCARGFFCAHFFEGGYGAFVRIFLQYHAQALYGTNHIAGYGVVRPLSICREVEILFPSFMITENSEPFRAPASDLTV